MLICDTGGLLAWIDGDHPQHDVTRTLMKSAEAVTSPLVLAEFDYLLRARFSPDQTRAVLEAFFRSGIEVVSLSQDACEQALQVDRSYADLNVGLADASLVLAQLYNTTELLTLDERHFRAMKPLQGGSFRLLPTDLS
ncbi:MAG: type II toxin-antitoxin system VapC family toxin [Mycobacteriales bacterium]